VLSNYKTMEFQVDLWLPVSVAAAARAIYEAATALLSKSDMSRIAERRKRLEARKRELAAENERLGEESGQRRPMHPRWVGYQLGKIIEPGAIVLDDAISNSDCVCAHHQRSQVGTYFASGGSSGGWGAGAAFGAKLAAPNRDVVIATGDGCYFMFGTQLPALWSAEHYKAPFLTVVFVNRSYTTGTNGLEAYLSRRCRRAHRKLRMGNFRSAAGFRQACRGSQLLRRNGVHGSKFKGIQNIQDVQIVHAVNSETRLTRT